jgi:hypothetical protein
MRQGPFPIRSCALRVCFAVPFPYRGNNEGNSKRPAVWVRMIVPLDQAGWRSSLGVSTVEAAPIPQIP